MQKKAVIIIAVIGTIVLGGGLWWLSRSSGKTESPISDQSPQTSLEPTKPSTKTLVWEDPAGFTFEYPEGIKINNHPEDKVNYANLEMTSGGKSGGIVIFASDTEYKTAGEWGTKNKRNSQIGGGGSISTLGEKSARKISFSDDKTTIIGVVDDEILFTIKLTPDENNYWQKAFDQIVASFKFWQPTPAESSSSASGGGGEIIEEEEIVE